MDLAKTWKPKPVEVLKDVFFDRKARNDQYDHYLAEVRRQFPVPALNGTVDFYFWNQTAILAAGLQYCPRPVFQSYSAYAPALERWNAAHLVGGQAPDNILLTMQTVDARFPSLDDGLSWPEILTRYDVVQAAPDCVQLKHSSQPRTYQLTPIASKNLMFGETFSNIPTQGLIWAQLNIDPTLSGKLHSLLYKPAPLYMKVLLRRGDWTCRIVPEMARCGFLLSPFVKDTQEFASLASAKWDGLTNQEMVSFSIFADTRTGTTSDYKVPLQLRLFRLEISRDNSLTSPSKESL